MMFESPSFPADLKREVYAWLDQNAADERAAGETPEQFYYKTRKKALGPFKQRLWDLPPAVRGDITGALQAKFEFLFQRLNVVNTYDMVLQTVKTSETHKTEPAAAAAVAVAAAKDDVKGLAD